MFPERERERDNEREKEKVEGRLGRGENGARLYILYTIPREIIRVQWNRYRREDLDDPSRHVTNTKSTSRSPEGRRVVSIALRVRARPN